KLGTREVELVKVDDESDPAKATDNVNKLIKRDNVDVIIGTVHSGVAMAMAKAAKDSGTILIVPNAGADAVTGPMCAPNIFRSSFSNWQPGYAMGEVMAKKGYKRVVTITWKYAAGDESVRGFKEAYEKSGGKVIKELSLPFPNVEFQALLTEIAASKPDAVYTFFAGGGAVKFVKDYAAAGLKKSIPLYGAGFLTDGTLEAQGADAEGLFTTLHYADSLSTARDQVFRLAYAKTFKMQPDVYAVQGYDAAQMLGVGLGAVKGDLSRKADFAAAHGSFYMIGAYMAFGLAPIVQTAFGGGFFSTLLVGTFLAVLLGYLLEWAFYSYLYDREHLQQVLMTYGLILVFEELRSLIIGDDVHGVDVPAYLSASIALGQTMSYPVYRLFISGLCLCLALGMYIVFTRTRLGMMIRAGSSNREMVQSLGIDIKFLYRIVFAAGVALAALAGMVAAPVSSVYPNMGGQVLIICFVVVVIGGIGSIRGALLAALLIGFADTFGKVLIPQASGVLIYIMMAMILIWKPQGLFKAG
ncbi:MAG: hypothetical protein EBW54_08565, partial [Betaproteobacteria bacterium]|nr:hypothetical protein [Betaproteobacteria bacterium]